MVLDSLATYVWDEALVELVLDEEDDDILSCFPLHLLLQLLELLLEPSLIPKLLLLLSNGSLHQDDMA